ncbi:hypothetical protein KW787_03125 [Candidatus Pacearchaeota archaeon]|nr:hypothetical protein [Candidatus Pacearchaeota archaeon]
MGIFGRESGDVLDFTMLQKRGILKKHEQEKDIIDLTQDPVAAAQQIVPISAAAPSPLSFFDTVSPAPSFFDAQPQNNLQSSTDVQSLKVKIDDLEYKLDRFLERVEMIESKLTDFARNLR